jgi:uncharacterized protein YndB with AHSA1/START domain
MSKPAREERVVVSTFVEVSPRDAFELFTGEIDLWWKRSPRYRRMPGQAGKLSFEGEPPAQLIETDSSGTVVLGRVLAWEAGKRVAFEWHGGELTEADQTQVEVRFDPHRGGTRVTLEHRGLGSLPSQHAARHGFSGEAFEAMFGYFWADLLTGYRLRVQRRIPEG